MLEGLITKMRIISGKARGTKLYTLEGTETRPTLDRVKESLFNHNTNRNNRMLFQTHLQVVEQQDQKQQVEEQKKYIMSEKFKRCNTNIQKNIEKTL